MTALRGELREHEPLARHTSWRVGGPADIWYRPADGADLSNFLQHQHSACLWLGLGSNLLVRDGGFRGAAVTLYGSLDRIQTLAAGRLRVEAGVHCARLAKHCVAQGLAGAAFFAGIPGSLGGALAMNAGAHGGETWERVRSVEVMDRQGVRRQLAATEFEVAYRSVIGPRPDLLFVAAELEFAADHEGLEAERLRTWISKRRETQPVGLPSCGSVFRNPPGDHAARLIEAAGLKGRCVGGAQVSEKHANFIINTGSASAADIEALISLVRTEVAASAGIQLHPEVRIVGEPA